jgi:ketosteroid isomerase-like protein
MKLLIACGVLLLALACSNDPVDVSVEAAERARASAITQEDGDAYERLVVDDLLVVDPHGALLTKDDRVDAVESALARVTRRAENVLEVRRYGDVALVLGEAVWQGDNREKHDYFTRIWAWQRKQWRLIGAHYTDISATVDGRSPRFIRPDHPIPALPVSASAPPDDAEQTIRRAIAEQHRAYWSKDPERYRQYAAPDLLRIAENGVRTQEQLIAGMRGNSRLPAPPSDHFDVRVRLFGNVAVATWLDEGTLVPGPSVRNRFTVVFAQRDTGWQMVHIQSTGVKD